MGRKRHPGPRPPPEDTLEALLRRAAAAAEAAGDAASARWIRALAESGEHAKAASDAMRHMGDEGGRRGAH
jgi:hypothetical protein